MNAFQTKVLEWAKSNIRSFPWRHCKSPFLVLVAEILLQKTTAEMVVPLFEQFKREMPEPADVASQPIERLENLFSNLGLIKRAHFLKNLSQTIISKYNGQVPATKDQLMALKGVGDYTANAVLCFAYGHDVPIVDGGIARLYRRVFGLESTVPAYADKELWRLAEKLVPANNGSLFNYALIDLSATICTPKEPKCGFCPLCDICHYTRKKHPGTNKEW